METFVGRKLELEEFEDAWNSDDPELIAVYGRRRVGKTALINRAVSMAQPAAFLAFTGQKNSARKTQLLNFKNTLSKVIGIQIELPSTWSGAFSLLEEFVEQALGRGPIILVFDEAPWLDGRRSGFLSALEFFWNNFACLNPRLKVVVCGSSAAWVIRKIVHGKGGWHRRTTRKLHVAPFTLCEIELFLKSRNIRYSKTDIIKLYAVLGGIPYYLKMIHRAEALETTLERVLFKKGALLSGEFNELFRSLFDNAAEHQKIVRLLAKRKSGYSRSEISKRTGITSGGGLSSYIDNLVSSDFVDPYLPLGKSADSAMHYRLKDLFCLFHFKWLTGRRRKTWESIMVGSSYKSWMGHAFEIIVWNHSEQIAESLGLKRIPWEASRAELKQDDEAAQCDLVIDAQGGSLYLIEMKFHGKAYLLTAAEARNIERRRRVLAKHFQGRRSVITCLLAPQGAKDSELLKQTVDKVLSANVLFSL